MNMLFSTVATFSLVWMFVYSYYSLIFGLGDRRHVNNLVECLAKDPDLFKDRHQHSLSGIGAGGIFTVFILAYPFIRHRRRNKAWSFDIFMWLNWLFFIVASYIYFFS